MSDNKVRAAALAAVEEGAERLLASALSFRVLIRVASEEKEEIFVAEKVALRKRNLEKRQRDEDEIRRIRSQHTLADVRPAMYLEDPAEEEAKLAESIRELKTKLFDETVQHQQLELLLRRIRLQKVMTQEVEVEFGEKAEKREVDFHFRERDDWVTKVLSSHEQLETLERESEVLDQQILEGQKQVRRSWKRRRGRELTRGNKKLKKLKPSEEKKVQDKNQWLRHVVTSMVLETKINWAVDPTLKSIILGNES